MSRRLQSNGRLAIAGGASRSASFPQARGTKGRIWVIHGLNDSAVSFASHPIFAYLVNRLGGLGYDVIVPSVTGDGSGQATTLQAQMTLDTTGAGVRAQWLADWTTWNTGLAPAAKTILVGISWGAPMCVQIANANAIDALAVHVPVLPPNNLSEFASFPLATLGAYTVGNLPPANRMYVEYATDDARVASAGVAAFVAATGCQNKVYSSLGHSTTNSTVNSLVAWVSALPF